MKDGRTLERQVDVLKGHPSRSMTADEITEKFCRCCAFAARPVSNDRAEAIMHAVRNLEELGDVRELGGLMRL